MAREDWLAVPRCVKTLGENSYIAQPSTMRTEPHGDARHHARHALGQSQDVEGHCHLRAKLPEAEPPLVVLWCQWPWAGAVAAEPLPSAPSAEHEGANANAPRM